jgi:uncharacterized protein (DUF1015 family)
MAFSFQGEARRVRGLIAAVDVEPWGGSIVPHERTMPGPVEDRLRLLRSVRANLSPVYAVATGPIDQMTRFLAAAAARPADREIVDEDGVEHRLWVVEAPDDGDAPSDPLGEALAAEQLLIADGHHRYTTALAYREEMRAAHGPGPWDRMMMLVVDGATEDPPVLPIHRVVRGGTVASPADGHRVRDLAEILATLHDDDLLVGTAERDALGGLVHRVCRLDGEPPTVCALHDQVVGDAELRFTPDAVAAEDAVRLEHAPMAFFLPPTHVTRIQGVIASGTRMPEKSTYFWPKPRTGMVIRALEPHPEPTVAGGSS